MDITELINKNIDLNCKDNQGYFPYTYAVFKNKTELLKDVAFDEKKDMDKTFEDGSNMAIIAALNNDIELLEKIEKLGINLNVVTKSNNSGIDIAIAKNNKKMLEIFLNHTTFSDLDRLKELIDDLKYYDKEHFYDMLENRYNELYYHPDGPGYKEAFNHFNSIVNN